MDPLSIAAGCAGLISTIGSLSLSIYGFVRTCREARKDLDKVSWELQSLQSVLRLIEDDATNEQKPFPPVIGQHVLSIVSNCNSVILEIEACIAQYGQKRLKAQVTWAIGGQGDVEKLRTSLEAHKSSLELALDMHSLENTEQILQEIVRLQAQLPKDVTTPNDYVLQRFLEEMTTYTEMALDTTIVGGDDDSIRAFYDIEELSEASVERKRSDRNLATSNKPQLLNISEAEEASGALAKTNPGGDSTTSPNPQVEETLRFLRQFPLLREYAWDRFPGKEPVSLLQPNRTGSPARIPSEDEVTAQKRVPPVNKEVSTSERSDTRTREDNAWRRVLQSPDGAPSTLNWPQSSILAEPSSMEPSKDEAPGPDFSPTSKENWPSQSSDIDATEDKMLKQHMIVLNEPTIDSLGNAHVKLLNGNLAVDFRYLSPLNRKVLFMAKLRDEWGTWRFTAVTCPPKQFTAENYLLRPLTSSPPKFINMILSFRLTLGESRTEFARRWNIILRGVSRLYALQNTSVMIHIHGPTDWMGLDKDISAALQEMSINRVPEKPIASLDGHKLSHWYRGRDRMVLGKSVHCVMRETFTTIYPKKVKSWFSKRLVAEGNVALRIISTAPMTSDDTYRNWVTAIGQQLQSKLVIDMTEISEDYRSFSNYLLRARKLDKHLPHEEDTWGIGLKFVRFDDLIGYLREKGYGDKK